MLHRPIFKPNGAANPLSTNAVHRAANDGHAVRIGSLICWCTVLSVVMGGKRTLNSRKPVRRIRMQTVVGYWDLDLHTHQLSLCPRSRAMLGIVPKAPAPLDELEWIGSVHPDDLAAAFEQMNSAVRNGEPYLQTFRAVHANRSEHPILGVGRAVGAKGRSPHRFIGFNISLSLATDALEEQSRIRCATLNELFSRRPHSRLSNWVGPVLTTDEMDRAIELLTQAQIDCLLLAHQRLTSKQIARRLGISPHTVDQRIRRAVKILYCERRADAARLLASSSSRLDAG